jgi:hypothetical protein
MICRTMSTIVLTTVAFETASPEIAVLSAGVVL